MDSEELLEYMPEFYDGVYEMEELLKAQGKALAANDKEQEQILDNQFVVTASETGVKAFEEQLGIVPKPNATLEERKQKIILESAPPQPLTKNYLYSSSTNLLGMNVRFEINTALRTVTAYATGSISAVQANNLRNWLYHILPVNMILMVHIDFTTQSSTLPAFASVAVSYKSSLVSAAETSQI
ncbi:putative phage tail protein [Lactobacillus delbrueckii]|uniref:putative phage tail protein n=1 Tax=Lactobacillus delbrueckii TaxID=1584 RepID=UPI0025AFC0B5|nr:putative phage tail protein [Lactobacillus delbrueckii]